MRNTITYEQISPLVQYVEVASDMVQCHFHCPVKSKKIVAITRFSKFTEKTMPATSSLAQKVKGSALFKLKSYFGTYAPAEIIDEPKFHKENAIVHAFGKISERFIYSDEHKHFIYRF
ncbi:hypothetical protein JHD50_02990 [Sulfurimonas sp. MAG313]|nr:hypothetical protein [Sulfurimonas sp. MAG313]MDF1880278.1 hypothetical protein [Sulfurimonas sp. MAG313]